MRGNVASGWEFLVTLAKSDAITCLAFSSARAASSLAIRDVEAFSSDSGLGSDSGSELLIYSFLPLGDSGCRVSRMTCSRSGLIWVGGCSGPLQCSDDLISCLILFSLAIL